MIAKSLPNASNVVLGLATAIMSLVLVGCSDETKVVTSKVVSPNGKWIASSETDVGGGPGSYYDLTNIYLNRTAGETDKVRVITFSHEFTRMKTKLIWLDASHLRVDYDGLNKEDNVEPTFVAIKFSDINISMRNLQTFQ